MQNVRIFPDLSFVLAIPVLLEMRITVQVYKVDGRTLIIDKNHIIFAFFDNEGDCFWIEPLLFENRKKIVWRLPAD